MSVPHQDKLLAKFQIGSLEPQIWGRIPQNDPQWPGWASAQIGSGSIADERFVGIVNQTWDESDMGCDNPFSWEVQEVGWRQESIDDGGGGRRRTARRSGRRAGNGRAWLQTKEGGVG